MKGTCCPKHGNWNPCTACRREEFKRLQEGIRTLIRDARAMLSTSAASWLEVQAKRRGLIK